MPSQYFHADMSEFSPKLQLQQSRPIMPHRSLGQYRSRFYRMLMTAVGLTFGSAAHAVPAVGLSVNAQASSYGALYGQTFQQILQPGPVLEIPALTGQYLTGYATTNGSVQFGQITGSVSATGNGTITDTVADFFGIWEDYLVVTSATLSTGTPVSFIASLDFDSFVGCTGYGRVDAIVGLDVGNYGFTREVNSCTGALSGPVSFEVDTHVGDILRLEGQLHIDAESTATGSAFVDPPAVFSIGSETPGASYQTGSGTRYDRVVLAVPEPSALMLLSLGLLAFIASYEKRRMSRRRQLALSVRVPVVFA